MNEEVYNMTQKEKSVSGGIGACVDPFSLPCVDLDDKTALPRKPGLYFVIDGQRLLYIGRSKDLNQRWKGHHRYKQIKQMARFPQIAYLDCDDESLLWTEREIISRFKPLLNDTSVDRDPVTAPAPQPKQGDAAFDAFEAMARMPSYHQRHMLKNLKLFYEKQKLVEVQTYCEHLTRSLDGDVDMARKICSGIMAATIEARNFMAKSSDPLPDPSPDDTSGNREYNRTGNGADKL